MPICIVYVNLEPKDSSDHKMFFHYLKSAVTISTLAWLGVKYLKQRANSTSLLSQ